MNTYDADVLVRKCVFSGLRYPNSTVKTAHTALGVSEKNTIKCLCQVYGPNLQRVVLMPNRDEDGLGGHVQVLHPDSTIRSGITIPLRPFGVLVGMRLALENDSCVTDSVMTLVHKVFSQAHTQAEEPCIATHYNPSVPHKDAKAWSASLCSGDTATIAMIKTTAGERIPFLFVRTDAGAKIGNELRAIADEDGMTAVKYVGDSRVLWAQRFAKRKAERLLLMGVRAAGVAPMFVEDSNAHVPAHHLTPQLVVKVDILCCYNTVAAISGNNAQECGAVAFYQECADGMQSLGTAVVLGDSYASMYEFQGVDMRDAHSIANPHFNAVPMFQERLSVSESATRETTMRASTRASIMAMLHSTSADSVSVYGSFHEGVPMKVVLYALMYRLEKKIPVREYEPVCVFH